MAADGTHEVPQELGGKLLDAVVRALFGATWGEARGWISTGKIEVDGAPLMDLTRRVRAGATVTLSMRARKPRPETELPEGALVHVDPHVVVVNKPPGISSIPFEEGERGALDERVRLLLAKRAGSGTHRPNLGVVHRLDKETSGLLVFTRTWAAKQSLTAQFRAHTVHRRYFAIVHGDARGGTLRSRIVENRGDGLRGSYRGKNRSDEGQLAITHVEVIERLEGATLIACRLETGRTHQIRIHLSESGHPVVGDRVYTRHFTGAVIPAPRLMLHAAELGFVHPGTEAEMRWSLPLPADVEEALARLRVTTAPDGAEDAPPV